MIQRCSEPDVFRQCQHPDPAIRNALEILRRLVRGCVIHDHKLKPAKGLMKDRFDRFLQIRHPIVDGHQDRHWWSRFTEPAVHSCFERLLSNNSPKTRACASTHMLLSNRRTARARAAALRAGQSRMIRATAAAMRRGGG